MVQLSATRCSCIAILWVSLVSFAAITICVASQRVFIVVRVKSDPRFSVRSEMADLKETRENCNGNSRNAQNSFRWQCHGENTNFLMVLLIQTWVKHQEHIGGDLFWLWGYSSPGICSSRLNGEPILLPGGFEAPDGASSPKTSGTMAEPGLVASPWKCAGAHCFVCAAIFGR
jgi:hypothetical protein